MVQPGDDDLVAGRPAGRDRTGEAVGQRGHVRAEHHAVRVAADQVGDRVAGLSDDRVGTVTGRERAALVADAGPVCAGDRLDHAVGYLGAGGAVEVCVAVGERRVPGADRGDVQAHRVNRVIG